MLPVENKKAVVEDLLGERAHPITLGLLAFVIDLGRARHIPKIVEELARMASVERNHALAEVRIGGRPERRAARRLAEALSRRPAGRST